MLGIFKFIYILLSRRLDLPCLLYIHTHTHARARAHTHTFQLILIRVYMFHLSMKQNTHAFTHSSLSLSLILASHDFQTKYALTLAARRTQLKYTLLYLANKFAIFNWILSSPNHSELLNSSPNYVTNWDDQHCPLTAIYPFSPS